jgi:membrane protease YdiL (CAAX protease family)
MSDDLEFRPAPTDPAAAEDPESRANPQTIHWPAPHDELARMDAVQYPFGAGIPAVPPRPKLIPHLGHFCVFLALMIFTLIGSAIGTLVALHIARPHIPVPKLIGVVTQNIAVAISMQAVWYGILWALAALVFGLWWKATAGIGFAQGIHWNSALMRRWVFALAGTGVATGLLITLAGNFLPMPKAPPILEDLTRSRAGAWSLMIFGVTLAPLTEELAFRGLLLPGLINVFRWLEERRSITESVVRTIGIPLSILLTSIPFALMHSQQVSHAWGPVLLIGCVSIVLCIVRLRTNSLACSVLVHAFYNLTLFTGLLIQTDGFRHLEKLKG